MGTSRRQFLKGGAALGAGAGLGAALDGGPASAADPAAHTDSPLRAVIPFHGAHQAGILTPRPRQAIFVAFDAVDGTTPTELTEALRQLSVRGAQLTVPHVARLGAPIGAPIGSPDAGPTPDSGILGRTVAPDALTVTIGFGAGLFDKVGLPDRRPKRLERMPVFADDQIDPGLTHGDVLVQLCAGTQETVIHALRDLMRVTRGALAPRWKVEGFIPDEAREAGAGRNLLGFKDGTANPDVADARLMARLVWAARDEPAWAQGGTYAVVRIIRNRVEFWDRVGRSEQELMIGREKVTGRPLDGRKETDDPRYDRDPDGKLIPLDAHIRLARPRTADTEDQRLVRRSYNYSQGIDLSGQLDQGLVFVAFNQDPSRQFAKVQERLAGEPLVDYVVPVGGGYFFLPPGARDPGDWVGSGLFA